MKIIELKTMNTFGGGFGFWIFEICCWGLFGFNIDWVIGIGWISFSIFFMINDSCFSFESEEIIVGIISFE